MQASKVRALVRHPIISSITKKSWSGGGGMTPVLTLQIIENTALAGCSSSFAASAFRIQLAPQRAQPPPLSSVRKRRTAGQLCASPVGNEGGGER